MLSLLNAESSLEWIQHYFHPDGLHCSHCGAGVDHARHFCTNHRSQVPVYRGKQSRDL